MLAVAWLSLFKIVSFHETLFFLSQIHSNSNKFKLALIRPNGKTLRKGSLPTTPYYAEIGRD